ncbi:methyltransferase domain-containing protein [uncultured Pseudodesulfovibrio sp.]|uniref:class I SAM-dependent methyltransferase n=1 Tax=uncultured Pseudodesulfovibrio sp. TaxID=2035858 RepID=UPI0029C741A1|nr:methyltransferase domain-containing protein [uncultured Pseudodesulfovibrio sp.]
MNEYRYAARLYDPIVGPALHPIHAATVRALLTAGVDSMVDVCCGTGMLAGMTASSGIKSTGVDISRPMIDVARKKRPNAAFIHGDATTLSFPDNTFGAATISFALHEKPQALGLAILAETCRVVRSDGFILITDYRNPFPDIARGTGCVIRLVERIAGKEHYRFFREYMSNGCMDGFFRIAGINGRLIGKHLNGWAGIHLIEC